ncbi:hypothetical protein Poli38472_005046 [Pythium oligandrum]|uniref:glucan 1,3-beta-glucosidase n=1 Tax=Pythium oligandrum TaxID=41045 RepID=A0A8K1FL90_PYTOL|nr:hypothetical protein Poli38472_005046 [Pythium oligandrum]|eukprot:TMW62428.1 hypothetical protein Poli38472_005046 [Pythium oligandrum]
MKFSFAYLHRRKDFMASCVRLVVLLGCFLSAYVEGEHIQAAIRRGSVKVKGVNLGGWLVAERWMTEDAEIWQGVPQGIADQGEFVTMQYLGHSVGDARFELHRSTWITEPDIAEIARSGLNAVRVPVGYWIMGAGSNSNANTPNAGQWGVFAPGALKYLDELINSWALRHNVAVLLSLHAHQGSQNGKDHSAAPGGGVKQWSQYPANVDNSVELALFLAGRYRSSPAFLGMSMMNEPEYPTSPSVVMDYFRRVHQQLRSQGDDCVLVTAPMLSEQSPAFMVDFLRGAPNVWHEWHPYFKWGLEGQNEGQLIAAAQQYGSRIAKWSGNPLVLSEWSMGVWDQFAPFADNALYKHFGATQLAAYAPARGGYFFWSWRHSDDSKGKRSGWSMRGLLRAGLLSV